MKSGQYSIIKKNPFFRMMHGLNHENLSDHKVGMLTEVDVSSIDNIRESRKKEGKQAPSYTAFVIKAISLALQEHPEFSRVPIGLLRKKIIQLERIDVSVAVEKDGPGREQAAFAATIRDTGNLNLSDITSALQGIASATSEANRRWDLFHWIAHTFPSPIALLLLSIPRWSARLWIEHRGGSFFVSSPAKYGTDIMMAAWPWPFGISFGYVKERPAVAAGQVVARRTMWVTFSFDRRMFGGAPSARFFRRLCDILSEAEEYMQ